MGVMEITEQNKSHRIDSSKYDKTNLMMFGIVLVGLMVIFSYGVGNVSAASNTVYVNATGGSDSYDGSSPVHTTGNIGPYEDIATGVTNVNTGGTVKISKGEYTGVSNIGITITKSMNLVGQSKTSTIINAAKTNLILTVQPGVNVGISQLTFTQGNNAGDGGAIYNYGALTVKDSNFVGNTATGSGGAIYNYGTLNVTNTGFTGNTASGNGGAIYNIHSMAVTNSNFDSNHAIASGGAINSHGIGNSLTVTGSSFSNNIASSSSYGGGAIYTDNNGIINVIDSTFTGNIASAGGGAISLDSNSPVITGSTFTANIAFTGGAIFNGATSSSCTVTKSIFNGNIAQDGGAIWNQGPLSVKSSTFTNNVASPFAYGGAIYNVDAAANLVAIGNNFVGNSAGIGGAIDNNAATANIQFNRIVGNFAIVGNAINNELSTIFISNNWWGSNSGPATGDVVGTTVPSWLILKLSASPTSIGNKLHSTVYADLRYDNSNTFVGGNLPSVPIKFTTNNLGTISQASTVNGLAKSTFTSGTKAGKATIVAKLDNQIKSTTVTVKDTIPPTIILTSPKNGATGISKSANIIIKFSENIKAGTNISKIFIKNMTTGKYVSINNEISGNTLIIKTTQTRISKNTYEVYIPSASVRDLAGNNLAKSYTFKFKSA